MKKQDQDGGPQYAELTLTPIEVNIDGLRDFRAFLGRELDLNLRPGSAGIVNDHGMGVQFGGDNAGARIQAARRTYGESLQSSMANLAAYIEAAEIIIDAIHRVATKYGEADLSAAASSAKINQELSAAFEASALAKSQEIQRVRDQETHRELGRMRAGMSP